MRANISVHEPRQLQDVDTALAFSMEGANGAMGIERPAELVTFAWSPGWNSPQAWNKFQAEIGGAMQGGDSGKFLFSAEGRSGNFFAQVPAAFKANGELRLVPLHHIFGSDEQSARSAPIQARTPAAYVAVSAADAERLGANARITVAGQSFTLPVKRSALPAGVVGLPQGLVSFFNAGTAKLEKA